jgi:hypothetical protein
MEFIGRNWYFNLKTLTMRKLLLIALLLSVEARSQTSIEEFTYLGERYGANESYLGFNPTFSMLRNKVAPYPERHRVNALSFDFNYKSIDTDRGGIRLNFNNKGIGDLVSLLRSVVNGDKDIYVEETTYLGSLLAQIDLDLNVNRPNGRIQYSIGVSHTDYLYAGRYTLDSLNGQFTLNPQGWYLTAGPHVMINALLSDFLLAELSGGYGFTYARPISVDDAYQPDAYYPDPGFGNVKLELQSKWGVYACGHYSWIRNTGPTPSAGKRLDLFIGFRFMLDKSN